jgi:mono/diheme cytochrome c family protein
MAAYLKSVPAIRDSAGLAAVQTPPAQVHAANAAGSDGSGQSLGLRVFEGACASCHSFDGSGAVSVYASLAGNRTVNDAAAVNATQAVLQGARLRTAHGEVFMSAFGTAYSDAEIAAVLNYVTGRFGANTSAIKPDEVAGHCRPPSRRPCDRPSGGAQIDPQAFKEIWLCPRQTRHG